jgi:hypothetical protein
VASFPFIDQESMQGLNLPGKSLSSPSFLTSSWDKIEDWFTGRNADTTGMSPEMAKTAQEGQALRNAGLITAVLGGISSAFGAYYAAKTAQYQEKSQSSSFAFQSDMAAINASRAEMTAESIESRARARSRTIRCAPARRRPERSRPWPRAALRWGREAQAKLPPAWTSRKI